jgi:subtilisin family serine protease
MWAAANRMAITNNSYFVDPWLMTCDRHGEHVVQEAVRRAVDYGTRHGVLTVAAATNENLDLSGQPDSSCRVLPAGLRGVIAVSAVGPGKLKSSYSAYGLGIVDVTAPGGELATTVRSTDECILSTVPGGYERYCGTSMATPHATGVLALLASEHPKVGPQQLTRLLTNQAESVPCPADYDLSGTGTQDAYCSGYAPYNSFHGHGLVDAFAAVTQP